MSETGYSVLRWFFYWFLPLGGGLVILYFLISLPLRRQERARLFLDLLETGLQEGRSIEQTIVSASHSNDTSLGPRFHLLAAHLESGMRLGDALASVPRLLPPQWLGIFSAGEAIGDFRKVFPACRTVLKDGTAQTQTSYTYLVFLLFVVLPIIPLLLWSFSVVVLPKLTATFEALMADMETSISVPQMGPVGATLAVIQLILAAVSYTGAIFFVGGPRFVNWVQAGLNWPVIDWLFLFLPWKRKRMQRDFGAMLGILLDSGMPEEQAVQLAAKSTGNQIFAGRAERVVALLRGGASLGDALRALDRSGDFQWRLSNALHSGGSFFAALSGWVEALDAKAFQQEQTAAHGFTTLLVLLNGAVIGAFVVLVFQCIVKVLQTTLLW